MPYHYCKAIFVFARFGTELPQDAKGGHIMGNCLCNLFNDDNLWILIIALIIILFCCGCNN